MDAQDNSDLAAAAAAALEAPQFHEALQQPDFSAHHHQHEHDEHDPLKQDLGDGTEHELEHHDVDQDEHALDVSVHGLEIPDDVDVDVGHDNLNLDLGMGTPHDVDLDMGINDYRRPPTIRKGE